MRLLLALSPASDHGPYASLADHLDAAGLARHVDQSARPDAQAEMPELRDADLGPQNLPGLRHEGVSLLGCIRGELLARLLPQPHWRDGAGPNDMESVAIRAFGYPQDRAALFHCLSLARAWTDHWLGVLERHGPFTHAIVEQGTSIAARTLQEAAANAGLRVFAVAPFVTGDRFYMEERRTPLPNRSLLADRHYYEGLALPSDPGGLERARVEAERCWAAAALHDARRRGPALGHAPFSRNGAKTVLVIGQPQTDPALLDTPAEEASALARYRALMEGLLRHTPHRIVFQAGRPEPGPGATDETVPACLGTWSRSLPESERARVLLSDREAWPGLLHYVDYAVGLSTTDLLEACRFGLRPVQFGAAFFGGKGFTQDYDALDALLADFAADRIVSTLDLESYEAFEDFLVRALLLHLVPDTAEGRHRIAQRLSEPGPWPAAVSFDPEDEADDELADLPLGQLLRDVARNPWPWLLMQFGRRR